MTPVGIDPGGLTGPTTGQARGPGWRRTSPRRYVRADTPTSVEQHILEQAQRLPPDGAVGGWAALRLHGAAYVGEVGRPVPLVVPPSRKLRTWPGSDPRRGSLAPGEVVVRHGIPCLRPVRAAFDEAARAEPREAVVVLDMALAAGVVGTAELAAYAHASRAPGARQVRWALTLADGRSVSPAETWLRTVWCLDARLPRPLCNWPVLDEDGRHLGKPDIVCPGLGTFGEYDGHEHRREDRRAIDLGRADRFAGAGLEGFTVVARDRHDVARVVRRMHAAVARAAASTRPRTWRLAVDPGPP